MGKRLELRCWLTALEAKSRDCRLDTAATICIFVFSSSCVGLGFISLVFHLYINKTFCFLCIRTWSVILCQHLIDIDQGISTCRVETLAVLKQGICFRRLQSGRQISSVPRRTMQLASVTFILAGATVIYT